MGIFAIDLIENDNDCFLKLHTITSMQFAKIFKICLAISSKLIIIKIIRTSSRAISENSLLDKFQNRQNIPYCELYDK